jgi:hypothetical protein
MNLSATAQGAWLAELANHVRILDHRFEGQRCEEMEMAERCKCTKNKIVGRTAPLSRRRRGDDRLWGNGWAQGGGR